MLLAAEEHQDHRTVVQNVVDLLRLISLYKFPSVKFKECLEVFKKPNAIKELNRLIVRNVFHQGEKVKNAEELMQELVVINNESDDDSGHLNEHILAKLTQELGQVKRDSLQSNIAEANFAGIPISKWEGKHIRQWARHFGNENRANQDVVEAVAVIKRANFLHTGFDLTDTQILASLLALCETAASGSREEETRRVLRGQLLQVATGEGKSTIICVLAIVSALMSQNRRVDIITSSPVLAERDAKDKAKLYRMFDLTCSCNIDNVSYIRGENQHLNCRIN